MPKLGRNLRLLALSALGTFMGLSLCELGVRFLAYSREERSIGASLLFSSQRLKAPPKDPATGGCHYWDVFLPHPHYGFMLSTLPPCGTKWANRQGFLGDSDLPLHRDQGFFTILVLGGSVAQNFAAGVLNGFDQDGKLNLENPRWLASYLNDHYVSPNGKPFKVLNGAMQGNKFPVQTYVLEQFAEAVDGVISIDGYNEALYGTFLLPDSVQPDIYLPLIRTPMSFRAELAIHLTHRIQDFFDARPLLKYSYLNYFVYQRLTAFISGKLLSPALDAAAKRKYAPYASTPEGWSNELLTQWNVRHYIQSIALNEVVAKHYGVKYAHFLQPHIGIMKKLTDTEKSFVSQVPASIYKLYSAAFDGLSKEGHAAFSLLNVFRNETDSMYVDPVHPSSKGNQIMAERIARTLAKHWALRPLP